MKPGRWPALLAGAVLAAAFAITPAPAAAWSHLGHRLVCAVALMQLDSDDRAEVDRLSSRFRDPDGRRYRYFTQGCTFADTARGKARDGASGWRVYEPQARWHFLNAPRTARTVSRAQCHDDCVLHGIEHHFRIFANHDLPEPRRAEAMLLMSHWIADAHQPLHVGFEDDRGGNGVDVAPGGAYRQRNLHAVWDRGILEAALGGRDWWNFAKTLELSIDPGSRRQWRSADPLDWAQESFDIAVDERTRYCVRRTGGACEPVTEPIRLGADYQHRVEHIALDRIRRAGARLAAYLERGLSR